MPQKKIVLVYTKEEMVELARMAAFREADGNFRNAKCGKEDVVELANGSVEITIKS
jgi:hypothetical protein